MDLDAVRHTLEQRRDDARGTVDQLAAPKEAGSAQGFGKRIGDGTVEAISRLTEIGVGRNAEETLIRIERALVKLDEGTYGMCDSCGEPIAPRRLEVMPDSVLCIDCAAGRPRTHVPRRR